MQPQEFPNEPIRPYSDATEMANLQDKIVILQNLLSVSQNQLQDLRFQITDRISSAMTRITLFRTQQDGSLSETEAKWLDHGLNDMAHLSLSLDQWARWCDIVDPKRLDDIDALNSMVAGVVDLNPKPDNFDRI